MHEAAVGFQCPECVAEGRRTQRSARNVFGSSSTIADQALVTKALIAINAVMLLFSALSAGSKGFGAALFNGGLIGSETPLLDKLWEHGGSYVRGTNIFVPADVANGEYYRLISSSFMHFGLIHLALNMAVLYVVGQNVERELGKLRFSAVYFLSLLGGSAAAFYFGTVCQQLAGASGAVFGLMGALLILWKRQRRDISTIVVVVGINLVSNLFTNASLLGHLGGFVIGGLLTIAMVRAPAQNRNLYQIGAVVAAVVLLGGMFALRAAQLDTDAEVILEIARTCSPN